MDVNGIKSMLTALNLSPTDKEEIAFFLSMDIVEPQFSENTETVGEIACPICGSTRYVKNGRVRRKQRFVCRDCGRTFGMNSKSVISKTKLTTNQWNKYIRCMINGYSIRKSAEEVEVCVKTSFFMRHKILDSLRAYIQRDTVSGMIQADECFLKESYKGNHKKSGFKMPRPSRKRGGQVTMRGISREQICIGTAADRNGNLIMEMACRGRITSQGLERLYTGYIGENSLICTDSLGSYKTLAKKLNLNHKRIPSGQHSDGVFNLGLINSTHNNFKRWMDRFNGVSTRFLPNYLIWFKWLEKAKSMKDSLKAKQMWADAMAKQVDVRIETIRQREVVFV